MIRNRIRAVVVLLATLAATAMMLATTSTATASTPTASTPTASIPTASVEARLCETFGPFCVGSANLDLFTAVTERNPGRNLVFTPLNEAPFRGFSLFLIQFAGDTSKCVAAADNLLDVTIHPCSGGSGVIWALDTTNGHLRWINRAATLGRSSGNLQYLTGHNDGTGFTVQQLTASGSQSFSFAPIT